VLLYFNIIEPSNKVLSDAPIIGNNV